MSVDKSAHQALSFGDFLLDIDRGALLRNGVEIKIRPQAFTVLKYLLERHGTLVSKDELLQAVWGDKVVTEDSLTHCLIDIRKAIGDGQHQIVRTVPKRGFIFEPHVQAASIPDTVQHHTKDRWRWLKNYPLLSAAVVVVGVGIIYWWRFSLLTGNDAIPGEIATTPARSSIIVLPFKDMSAEQDQHYLADGLADEILNRLAKNDDLTVIARSTSFALRDAGLSIAEIVEKVPVDSILEGSVRKYGDRIRVTTHLVDADTSRNMWSESFDFSLTDVLKLQTEVAVSVANELLGTDVYEVTRTPDSNIVAYSHYLQGKFFFQRGGPGDLQRASLQFEKAVSTDPVLAPGWVGLAATHVNRVGQNPPDDEDLLNAAWEGIVRALGIDPALAEAHVLAGRILSIRGNHQAAEDRLRLAESLDPNNPELLAALASQAGLNGNLHVAIRLMQRVVAVDPLSAKYHGQLAIYLLAEHRTTESQEHFDFQKEISPFMDQPEIEKARMAILVLESRFNYALTVVESWPAGDDRSHCLALIYHGLGMVTASQTELEQLRNSDAAGVSVRLAEIHAFRGEYDLARAQLGNSLKDISGGSGYQPQRRWLLQVAYSPFLRPIRELPDWQPWFADALAAKKHRRSIGNRLFM